MADWDGTCPDCHGRAFRDGPRGGMSINLECLGCGCWINVARWQGHQFFLERLGHRTGRPEAVPPKA